jgi:electron transfer flavoprotein alpha subunit
MNETQDVVVFLESSGENRRDINEGLLTEGHRIATNLGGGLSAMIVGPLAEDVHLLERYGVATLYHVEGDGLLRYSVEDFAWASARALTELPFRLLLFAQSDRGAELAPRVAFALGRGAVTDCVDIGVRDSVLFYVRSVYGDQLQQEVSYRSPGREIASLRCDVLNEGEPTASGRLQVRSIPVKVPSDLASSAVVEVIPPDYRTVDILFAKRIIGAGSGCADPPLLSLVEKLSLLLQGSIAATRPVVDEGFLPKDRMVGQTGKTVAPEIYLALGISGSPHHVAGIQRSKRILSVNRDRRAPIFSVADVGFACDLRSLLPKLIDRITRYRDESVDQTHEGKDA